MQSPDLQGKRVLIVIARLNKGGTAQYLEELTVGLQRAGLTVCVATGFVQGLEIEADSVANLPVARIPSLGRRISPIRDLKARHELQALVDEFKPDLIYTHTFKAGLIGRTLRRRVKLIHAFHGHLLTEPELQGFRRPIVILIERLLASRAERLVTVGKRVAEELLEVGIGRPSQYQSIAPGVRPITLEDRATVRSEFKFANDTRPVVAWLARVTAVKAPHRVVELAQSIPGAIFVQAGGGDLLNQLKKEPPIENWHLLGWQPATKIWAIADIAISTSENEGMPVALIEAQLAGIPAVALDVGSVAEVIRSGETGFVLKQWNQEFIERLSELVDSNQLRAQFGHNARNRAIEEFKPERLINEHIKLFQSVLNSGG